MKVTRILLGLALAVTLGTNGPAAAQGVGARAAAPAQTDDAPPPPPEDGEQGEQREVDQEGVDDAPVATSAADAPAADAPAEEGQPPTITSDSFVIPPALAHEQTLIDPLDELEMARAAQDRANADREAQEELARAEVQAELNRVIAERQESDRIHQANVEASNQRERELVEILAREREGSQEPAGPTTIVVDESDILGEELESFVQMFGTDRSFWGLLTLLFLILLTALLAAGVRRLRDGLAPSGILPMLFAFIHLAARLLVVALTVAFVVRFLPPRMSLVLLLAFAGASLAVGWSARDLLPDLIAGIILAFERRVRQGMWISSKEFSGQVERVGLRSSALRDAQGNEVSVPNRFILGAPIATDSTREREQDVTLRLSGYSAAALREAIIDAVLGSPWVAPHHRPLVYRDPDEPELWHVRARLLEARYGVRFEGELLERTEAVLDAIIARDTAVDPLLARGEAASDKESDT